MHRTGVLAEDDEGGKLNCFPAVFRIGHFLVDDLDAEQRRCGLQIHVDCEKLKEKWAELGAQFSDWDKAVHAAAVRLQELERALAECQLHLRFVAIGVLLS